MSETEVRRARETYVELSVHHLDRRGLLAELPSYAALAAHEGFADYSRILPTQPLEDRTLVLLLAGVFGEWDEHRNRLLADLCHERGVSDDEHLEIRSLCADAERQLVDAVGRARIKHRHQVDEQRLRQSEEKWPSIEGIQVLTEFLERFDPESMDAFPPRAREEAKITPDEARTAVVALKKFADFTQPLYALRESELAWHVDRTWENLWQQPTNKLLPVLADLEQGLYGLLAPSRFTQADLLERWDQHVFRLEREGVRDNAKRHELALAALAEELAGVPFDDLPIREHIASLVADILNTVFPNLGTKRAAEEIANSLRERQKSLKTKRQIE